MLSSVGIIYVLSGTVQMTYFEKGGSETTTVEVASMEMAYPYVDQTKPSVMRIPDAFFESADFWPLIFPRMTF
jgi:hypothetical protein